MEEVSAQAHVAADGVDSPLAVAVSRDEVERTLEEGQEADLLLDVVRSNGQREEQRVLVALDTDVLRHLLTQEGEQVLVGIDPESLAKAFDDVELHGLREVGATLAIAVAAVGGGAGTAAAQPEPAAAAGQSGAAYVAFQTDFPVTQAAVVDQGGLIDAGGGIEQVRAMHEAAGNLDTVEAGMPRAMPSDYAAAAADEGGVQLRRDPGAVSNIPATTQAPDRGIENVRAARPAPEAAPDPSTMIENVRAGGSAVPDGTTAVENIRAQVRAPEITGAGGISAPAAGVLVGGALLTIAAAMFAARRRVEPRPA
jgi:hypothetical protein